MMTFAKTAALAAAVMVSAGVVSVGGAGNAMAQAANPCAPKAANPCAAKPANPCAAKAAGMPEVLRPSGTKLATGDHKQLVKQGEALFKDAKLSTNGMSCNSCHADLEAFQPSFAQPYPHQVEMANEQGISKIALDEMVQLCMVVPMEAKPLKWDSKELAALTAYTGELQKQYQGTGRGQSVCAEGGQPVRRQAGKPLCRQEVVMAGRGVGYNIPLGQWSDPGESAHRINELCTGAGLDAGAVTERRVG